MGLGMKVSTEYTMLPKPREKVLSLEGTQRRANSRLLDLPVAPTNFRKHMTARKMKNCLLQSTGQTPSKAICDWEARDVTLEKEVRLRELPMHRQPV